MIALVVVTVIDILVWLFRSVYWANQMKFVRKRLREFDTSQRDVTASQCEAIIMAKLVENYLRRDGMFILRLIGLNVGDVAAGEILTGLWNNYSPKRKQTSVFRKQTSVVHLNGSSLDSKMDV